MEPFTLAENKLGAGMFSITPWTVDHPRLIAGFSSRKGGVSSEPFGLNCALHVDDKLEDVLENRKRLTDALAVPFESWTCAEQVHGHSIAIITEENRGRGRHSREEAIPASDGLVTNVPDVLLTAFFADCVPLYFYDDEHQVVGLAHAGWRGTADAIAARMVEVLKDQFHINPAELRAAIGPSIGQCCYEVDRKVIDAIRPQLDCDGMNSAWIERENDKYLLDLRESNRQILIKAGIMPYHIEITDWCTSCQNDLFFSHRKERGRTGRMTAWIGLRRD